MLIKIILIYCSSLKWPQYLQKPNKLWVSKIQTLHYILNVKYNFSSRIKKNIQKLIAKVSSKVVDGIFLFHILSKLNFKRTLNMMVRKKVVYHGLDLKSKKNYFRQEKTIVILFYVYQIFIHTKILKF